MRKLTCLLIMVMAFYKSESQELYVSTEPASNMAAGSIGLRLNNKFFRMDHDGKYSYRLDPEIMVGLTKHLMIHANAYASNMFQPEFKFEGASMYAKYRFYSKDDVQSHFRMAAYAKASVITNPSVLIVGQHYYSTDAIDLDGSNSGWQAGLVATQLLHKLALSSSFTYTGRWDNVNSLVIPGQSSSAINYSLSGGYLLLPVHYINYRQTNFNLYCEFLGSSAMDKKAYYIDIAPAVQFIFNSISRLDFSYRTQLTGNMERLTSSGYMIRFEYNFLNVFKNRQ